jgi:hypothetical protein
MEFPAFFASHGEIPQKSLDGGDFHGKFMGNSQRKWMISMDFYTARNAFIQLWGSPMNSWISMGNSQEIDDFYGGRMAD